jgi:hypothetical protein
MSTDDQPRSERPSIARTDENVTKIRQIILEDRRRTIDEVLKRLLNSLRRKRPDLWQRGEWFFHHDNAPAHTALSVQRFLTRNAMTPLSCHPILPRATLFYILGRKAISRENVLLVLKA